MATTRRRVISYWGCYHRSAHPQLGDYVGLRVLEEFERWGRSAAAPVPEGRAI